MTDAPVYLGFAPVDIRLLLPTTHDTCFDVLMIDEAGTLDLSANDTGNWTGGAVGYGKLTGSRWGISSASYPTVNKVTLTRDQAKAIYLRDFWTPNLCDEVPEGVRFLVYSCAVNSGADNAGLWLQRAIMEQTIDCGGADGNIGPMTVAASLQADPGQLIREMSAQRLFTVSQDLIFAQDHMGLCRRIVNDAATAALLAV